MHSASPEICDWATSAFPDLRVVEQAHGSFHAVLLGEEAVCRVLLGERHEERAAREAGVLRQLPDSIHDMAVPRLVCEPLTREGRTGYLVSRVPGEESELDWAHARAPIATAIAALQTLPTSADWPAPRDWCGGEDWPRIVAEDLAPHLGEQGRSAAQLAESIAADTDYEPVFCHGDFGPHNLLWQGSRIASILDFDHACLGDPATDVAPLIGVVGARAASALVDERTLQRAMVLRASLALQVAAAAHLAGLDSLRGHACANFVQRANEGTLFDPEGALEP